MSWRAAISRASWSPPDAAGAPLPAAPMSDLPAEWPTATAATADTPMASPITRSTDPIRRLIRVPFRRRGRSSGVYCGRSTELLEGGGAGGQRPRPRYRDGQKVAPPAPAPVQSVARRGFSALNPRGPVEPLVVRRLVIGMAAAVRTSGATTQAAVAGSRTGVRQGKVREALAEGDVIGVDAVTRCQGRNDPACRRGR